MAPICAASVSLVKKTAPELPDDLAERARSRARRAGTTLHALGLVTLWCEGRRSGIRACRRSGERPRLR